MPKLRCISAPMMSRSYGFRWSVISIGLLLVTVMLVYACAPSSADEMQALPGQEVTLSPGQTVTVRGEGLSLQFKGVTADSRCPKGVTCVWAGEAKCSMQFTLDGVVSEALFTVNGGADGYARSVFGPYTAYCTLTPYPEAGKQIGSQDYRLRLKVLKTGPV